MKQFVTVKDYHRTKTVIKKSIFTTTVKPVNSEEEAKAFISDVRREFSDANHNVYSYIVGENCQVQRFSDDGEPSGTAGTPVLEVLKKAGLTNVAIVVTRYFGGILLGTGGLVRAYSEAVKTALDEVEIVTLLQHRLLEITTGYDLYETVKTMLNHSGGYFIDTKFTEVVKLQVYIPEKELELFLSETMRFENIVIIQGYTKFLARN